MRAKSLLSFEAYANKLIEKYHIPGVGIGISHQGRLVYEQGFGYRDREMGLEVTADTVFGVASITKSFTCVAVMKLQEEGRLTVQDKVLDYIPELQIGKMAELSQMTIHHLMTHSSGLPPLSTLTYASMRSLQEEKGSDLHKQNDVSGESIDTHEELIAFINKQDPVLLGSPGTVFSYSNDGYGLLGIIIHRVSGLTYEEYVHKTIMQPAEMNHTTFFPDDLVKFDKVTTLYEVKQEKDRDPVVFPSPVWWDSPAMRGSGKIKSTVKDMLAYSELFSNYGSINGVQILKGSSIQQMMTPYIECAPGKYYGYGLMITPDYYGDTLVEHGGNSKAIAASLAIIPEKRIAGIIVTNLAGVPATTLLSAALNDYQGRPIDSSHPEYQDYEMSEEALQSFVGTYTSYEGMKVVVERKGNSLIIIPQGIVCEAKCIGEDLFHISVKDQSEIVRFLRNDTHQVCGIGYHYRQFPKDGLC